MKLYFLSFIFLLFSIKAMADKTTVKIDVAKTAIKGTEVKITIHVSHKGNTAAHFTDWVYVKINGTEVKRWIYDKKNLPPSADFTLVYKFTINETSVIEVMGDCNLHGSEGAAIAKVTVL